MKSILVNAHNTFEQSLAKYILDPDVLEVISGGAISRCKKDQCSDLACITNADGTVTCKISCVECS